MKVEWTDAALEQLWAIHEYIAQSSLEYAQRVPREWLTASPGAHSKSAASRSLAVSFLSTKARRFGKCPQIREVFEGPYCIIYYIKPDQIDVLAVIHGKQQAPWNT